MPRCCSAGTSELGTTRLRVTAWLSAHPRLADAGWALLCLMPLAPDALIDVGSPRGAVAATLAAVPLVWRRAAPLRVLVAVALLCAPSWALLGARPAFAVVLVLVAAHGVALVRPQRAAVTAAVVVSAVVFFCLAVTDALARGPHEPPTTVWAAPVVTLALLAATVFIGVAARQRRERLELLEERAERLRTERDRQGAAAAAAERARIAGELHDVVAHALTVVVRLGDGLAARAARDPDAPADPTALAALTSTARQAMGEMRHLLEVLGPDHAADPRLPLGSDLEAVIARVRAAGVPVRLTRQGPQDGWPPAVGLAVHRIVVGALTNVLDHAGLGARAEVLLRSTVTAPGQSPGPSEGEPPSVEVVVDDDGVGVGVPPREPDAPREPGRGRGLSGLAERADATGGQLWAGPRPEGGWRVRAVLPLPAGEDSGAP